MSVRMQYFLWQSKRHSLSERWRWKLRHSFQTETTLRYDKRLWSCIEIWKMPRCHPGEKVFDGNKRHQYSIVYKWKGKASLLCGKVFWKCASDSLRSFIDWQHHTHLWDSSRTWLLCHARLYVENLIYAPFFPSGYFPKRPMSNCAALSCWLKLCKRSERTTITLNDSLSHLCSEAFR